MRSLMTVAILLALCSTANAATLNKDGASHFDATRYTAAPFLAPADEDDGEGPRDGSTLRPADEDDGEGPGDASTPRLAPADEDDGEGPGDSTRVVATRPADEDDGEGPNGT